MKVPFHCVGYHMHMHLEEGCNFTFVRNIWRKKEVFPSVKLKIDPNPKEGKREISKYNEGNRPYFSHEVPLKVLVEGPSHDQVFFTTKHICPHIKEHQGLSKDILLLVPKDGKKEDPIDERFVRILFQNKPLINRPNKFSLNLGIRIIFHLPLKWLGL